MKTGDVAKTLNVSRKTIANWTMIPEIKRFFSEGALRLDEGAENPEATTAQRDFNDSDLVILNTIRVHKTRTNSWSDIARMLDSGERVTELPPSAYLVETLSPVEQMQSLMLAKKDLEIAQARIDDLQEQLAESNRLRSEERARLQDEIRQLDRENAVLKYRLEQLEDNKGE